MKKHPTPPTWRRGSLRPKTTPLRHIPKAGSLARISHQLSGAAANPGIQPALRSLGLLDALRECACGALGRCPSYFYHGLLAFILLAGLTLAPARRTLAQGSGVVEGKLINRTDPTIKATNIDLDVLAFAGGMGIIKSSKTDSTGKFMIGGLPTDQMLLIRANYKGANYIGRVNFDPAGKANMEIDIYETTTSMKDITTGGVRMAFQLTGSGLQSVEVISFDNQTRPPRTFMSMKGNYRFSKSPGITEPPKMNVTGPGSPMPLLQSPLESPDGQSYYSLYPLRPGVTTFEIQEALPYANRSYEFRKKFYEDISGLQIGVIPRDMVLTGAGLTKVQDDEQRNFAVYSGGPLKAGTEVVWTFSGGTPVVQESSQNAAGGESRVKPYPTLIAQNALVIGPILLIGFVAVLWYAFNHVPSLAANYDARTRELKARREHLLDLLANLDSQYENQVLARRDYLRQREQGKRQLRRVSLLLKK